MSELHDRVAALERQVSEFLTFPPWQQYQRKLAEEARQAELAEQSARAHAELAGRVHEALQTEHWQDPQTGEYVTRSGVIVSADHGSIRYPATERERLENVRRSMAGTLAEWTAEGRRYKADLERRILEAERFPHHRRPPAGWEAEALKQGWAKVEELRQQLAAVEQQWLALPDVQEELAREAEAREAEQRDASRLGELAREIASVTL